MLKRPLKNIGWILSFLLFAACENGNSLLGKINQNSDSQGDTLMMADAEQSEDTLTVFDHLMEKGTLVAVTNCADINYNMHNAHPSGFQYELLKGFCDDHHLKLEMVLNDNTDSCFRLLDSCKVDVVATGTGLTKELKRKYFLTNPIFSQKSVLVQRMPKGWGAMSTENEVESQLLRSPLDLAGKTVHVAKGNHEAKVLEYLSEVIADTSYVVECDTLNSIDLMRLVHEGSIDYTVVDEYIAKMVSYGLNGLDIELAVSVEQPIGWVIRQEADSSLVDAFNDWIASAEQKHLRRVTTRYLKNGHHVFSTKREASSSSLSAYDNDIKRTASHIGWDWRLLAALIYQESRFRSDLESEKGAFGLMQLMPSVMERYGIDYDSSPVEQLEAGGKLIKFLDDALENKVTDSTERVKFVLAAYNAGLGHVLDAQRLAKKYGKASDLWDDNVDFFILNKSKFVGDTCCKCGYLRGGETYRFVADIMERYQNYQALIE